MTRRARASHALALATLSFLTVLPAHAQSPASVPLTLAFQTPWTTLEEPVLHIDVVATNNGALALRDLSAAGVFGPAFSSRQAYEDAIVSGPSSVMASQTIALKRRLDPGQTRTFRLEFDMSSLPGVAQDDSKVYPASIELRSAGVAVAHLFTSAIHLVRVPEQPMLLSWWYEVTAGPAFGPDGRLQSASFEAAVAPGGALSAPMATLGALTAARRIPFDLVIQPSVLEQARTMAAGYERADGAVIAAGEGPAAAAQAFLDQVRAVAGVPSVQVVGLPLDAPSVPALLGSGLGIDLTRHEDRGDALLRQVLNVDPAFDVARPPGNLLSESALIHYAAQGRTTLLADADTVARPAQDQGFVPSPTASVAGLGAGPVDLVLPDPGVQALMERVDVLADPVRGAQVILGELAVIWKEEPNPDEPRVRGVAIAPPPDLPPTIWPALVGRLSDAPFLEPVHAQEFVARVFPAGENAVLLDPATTTFSDAYAQRILALHHDIDAYASMLVEPGTTPDGLRRRLLRAESQIFLGSGETAAQAWIDPVAELTGAAFASTTPQVQQVFTFTSGEGTVPLRMGDPGDIPLRVVVVMQASQFDFPGGAEQEVTLERPNQLLEFDVRARASGQNPIAVTVRTPNGREISTQTIVVRTTELNSIALLITGGAGVGLLLLYARRRLRRAR
ncbi:MAG: hypothetical protein WD096_07305 [Actinomycetota bacterium]